MKSTGQDGYEAFLDLDGNGSINDLDLSAVSGILLQTVSHYSTWIID